MLTEQAMKERKWGAFPTLRRVLEDKPLSGRYYGPTSVADNIFEFLHRLVDIATASEEHEKELLEVARCDPDVAADLAEDLERLRGALEATRDAFAPQIERLCSLRDQAFMLARR